MKLMRVVRWTVVVVPLALLCVGFVAYWRSTNACEAPRPGPPANPMRAVVYCDYGSPDVLKVEAIAGLRGCRAIRNARCVMRPVQPVRRPQAQ